MQEYTVYIKHIRSLINAYTTMQPHSVELMAATKLALDGGAGQALRDHVSIEKLRQFGAFFTGSQLADKAIETIADTLNESSVILDNACGAGDLLIACAKHLPTEQTVEATLSNWAKQLRGHDINTEFVTAAKARLLLSLFNRCSSTSNSHDLESIFPYITQANGLEQIDSIQQATHIVINPPFVRTKAPDDCSWTNAHVNSAALFLEMCVTHANVGTRIVAILPDVLRSGTNYAKWRKEIEARANQHNLFLFGQFDKFADVDVFVIDLEITDQPNESFAITWQSQAETFEQSVADKFNVHCGRVVEYRDPHKGPELDYIVPRNLPCWEVVESIAESRQFDGKTYHSPFVVVRRTSRKGHAYRAVGTIINTGGEVAVENHLLVLLPKSGTLDECQALLARLQSEQTNRWLDERIRCRHLTVSSLKELPWWEIENDEC